MARWEPDSRGRLAEAAFTLYMEKGFESTTVAEIAERAGVTERTFFRQFKDKREVLFDGANTLQNTMVDAVAGAPGEATPLDAIAAGLATVPTVIPDHEFASRRQSLIDKNPELMERELIKLDTLSAALAGALRARGVEDPAASLTAGIGIAVFRNAFERWVGDAGGRTLEDLMVESLQGAKAAIA